MTGIVGDIAASGPSAASGAYSGAPITLGGAVFGAPGGGTSSMINQIIIGLIVAVLAGLLLKEMGKR